jgi:serine protease Do
MNQESKSVISAVIASVVTTVVVLTLGLSIVVHNHSFTNLLAGTSQNSPAIATQAGNDAVVAAVKKANPAVVSIIITKNEPVIERYYTTVPDPFGFNIQVPQYRQNGTQPQEVGGGSGFLVSADGLIATNEHVVSDANAEYTVYTNDGKKHSAKVISKDPTQDIAIIKIDPVLGQQYPYLTFGDSSNLQLGQAVIAIGNALGEFRNTVSDGVVSGLSRSIVAGDVAGGNAEALNEVIQTDAAINPGNSGGPLLDIQGNVIGMNVAVAVSSQNIGFALPSDIVKNAVESVKTKGFISHPFLGVRYLEINDTVAQAKKLSVNYGVLVTTDDKSQPAVVPNSPAAKAGVVEGDIILDFDGTKLDDTHKLANLIAQKKAGDTVTLTILHNGQQKTLSLILADSNAK